MKSNEVKDASVIHIRLTIASPGRGSKDLGLPTLLRTKVRAPTALEAPPGFI